MVEGGGRGFNSLKQTFTAKKKKKTYPRPYSSLADCIQHAGGRMLTFTERSTLVFTTGMPWLQWTAILERRLRSSSLRNGPNYTALQQLMHIVLQVLSKMIFSLNNVLFRVLCLIHTLHLAQMCSPTKEPLLKIV